MCHSLAAIFSTAPIFGQTKPTKLPLAVSIVSKTGFGFSKINEKTSFGF